MSAFAISVIVFLFVFGGAVLGLWVGPRLHERHLVPESREAVRLVMGIVATTVAIVLGMLIASAKTFYDTQSAEVTQLASDTVLLHKLLGHYGPESKPAQAVLQGMVSNLLAGDQSDGMGKRFDPQDHENLYDAIQALTPTNDAQKRIQSQALDLTLELGKTRWLMFEQKKVPLPRPLLLVMVFWLVVLFFSFSVFSKPNLVVCTALFVAALALSAAVFVTGEMYQPYQGLIQVSDAPLRVALSQIAP